MTRRSDRMRHRLGDLQLAILEVLWNVGEASATEVHRALSPTHGLAPTTIATMLRKMDDRGLVGHRRDGRFLVYRPAVGRDEVRRSMVDDLVARLFKGDPRSLVHHLLTEGEIGADEVEALKERVRRARRQRRGE